MSQAKESLIGINHGKLLEYTTSIQTLSKDLLHHLLSDGITKQTLYTFSDSLKWKDIINNTQKIKDTHENSDQGFDCNKVQVRQARMKNMNSCTRYAKCTICKKSILKLTMNKQKNRNKYECDIKILNPKCDRVRVKDSLPPSSPPEEESDDSLQGNQEYEMRFRTMARKTTLHAVPIERLENSMTILDDLKRKYKDEPLFDGLFIQLEKDLEEAEDCRSDVTVKDYDTTTVISE
ncbi:hypothetical protein BN7_6726 [Wickerhamomyces ciferrii]|uniref:Uncharacterized protein n=1 Tax=Wickerhamomyces ciferrii (strain ATCC 14091 / BCRC 22168 / CBS 111 / JCM 3599 / NBRC 0793 / NRRL Y-1031 F-60-10) TaxID=1206466 RepID=K0KPB0_WICCF|nr:uncharacterized protein BN7_6726 [Wickerhamomyces ciferrii]CCH47115.1 hypothetical protein BN7_6726 [Wickerhamomyces ciferrii]